MPPVCTTMPTIVSLQDMNVCTHLEPPLILMVAVGTPLRGSVPVISITSSPSSPIGRHK